MNTKTILLGDLRHFFENLLFPDIVFGNSEHFVFTVLFNKVIEVILRMDFG